MQKQLEKQTHEWFSSDENKRKIVVTKPKLTKTQRRRNMRKRAKQNAKQIQGCPNFKVVYEFGFNPIIGYVPVKIYQPRFDANYKSNQTSLCQPETFTGKQTSASQINHHKLSNDICKHFVKGNCTSNRCRFVHPA